MKKTIGTLIGLICLVIIIVLALPKYFSSQNQNFVQNFIDGIEKGSDGQITGKVIKESDGWFSSSSTVEFNYNFRESNLLNPDDLTGKLLLQLTNHYGPLLFTDSGVKFGKTLIEGVVSNNQQTANYFQEPLLQGSTLINFADMTTVNIAGLKALPNSEIKFNGINATAELDSQVTHINGHVNFNELSATDKNAPNTVFTISPFTKTFNLNRKSANDLWYGSADIEIPSITLTKPDFKGQFNKISIKSNSDIDHDLLNGNLIISIDNFAVNQETGNYKANLALNNLNAIALKKINTIAKNFNAAGANPQQLQAHIEEVTNNAIDVFAGKSVVQFDSILNLTHFGNISINAGFDNSTALSKITFSAKGVKQNVKIAGLDLSLSGLNKATFGKMLRAAIAASQEAEENNASKAAAADKLQQTLTQLYPQLFTPSSEISLNIVLPENLKSGFQLLDAKAYFNQLPQNFIAADVFNHAQLIANWKIPVYATDIIKTFGPLVISKMQNSQNQALVTNLYNIFQQLFPQLVQQGYITQAGNYYLTNWNISSQGMLMNNKPIQPLIMQLQQQQQPTPTSTPTPTSAPVSINSTVPAVPITLAQ